MKSLVKFFALLAVCIVFSILAWDVLVMGKVYYCTDEVGLDFLSPGDWIHNEVVTVSQIDGNASMDEPDQILRGWTTDKLWALWIMMLAISVTLSFGGSLYGRRQ